MLVIIDNHSHAYAEMRERQNPLIYLPARGLRTRFLNFRALFSGSLFGLSSCFTVLYNHSIVS